MRWNIDQSSLHIWYIAVAAEDINRLLHTQATDLTLQKLHELEDRAGSIVDTTIYSITYKTRNGFDIQYSILALQV